MTIVEIQFRAERYRQSSDETVPKTHYLSDVAELLAEIDRMRNEAEGWQPGDIVLDDTGNMFCFHSKHGWHGVIANQNSARGPHTRSELAGPLTLLVRDRRPAN